MTCNGNFRFDKKDEGSISSQPELNLVTDRIILKLNFCIDLMFTIPFLDESGYNGIGIG